MTALHVSSSPLIPTASSRLVDARAILLIARREVREALRNRWFLLYTGAFIVLSLALSFASLAGTGAGGFASFSRTAAGLSSLVMLIVPLMALTAGAGAIAGERERGSLAYLLTHPITRLELLLGKYLGLAVATSAATIVGFGVSGLVLAWQGGSADAAAFIRLAALSSALALAMLSVGLLISACVRRASVAMGWSVFAWLGFVFVGDLGLLGSTLVFRLQVTDLFRLAMLNPLQVFKMASLHGVDASLDVLGPAGLYAEQTYGETLSLLFTGALAGWIVVPLAIAAVILSRRNVT